MISKKVEVNSKELSIYSQVYLNAVVGVPLIPVNLREMMAKRKAGIRQKNR